MSVEVLYLAHNRLAFTKASFTLLRLNTDWSKVSRLVVYDDNSMDGTRNYLLAAQRFFPGQVEIRRTMFGSPVKIMADYLDRTDADVFAKIDNDIALPAGWLETSLAVMDSTPRVVDLLGLAAGWTGVADGVPGWQASSHIGGVGLMRVQAFRDRPKLEGGGRFGFTEWQHDHEPVRGWITPDLPVPQLDLIPAEPWRTLAREYVKKGWAREWPPYEAESHEWWDWIAPQLAGA